MKRYVLRGVHGSTRTLTVII